MINCCVTYKKGVSEMRFYIVSKRILSSKAHCMEGIWFNLLAVEVACMIY